MKSDWKLWRLLFVKKKEFLDIIIKKLSPSFFQVGDLVWKTILPIEVNSRKFGKWSPNWEGPFEVEKVFSNNAYQILDISTSSRILSINE